jgi:hypothetical protein
MMVFLSVVVFVGALSLALAVIASSVLPQWQRILRLACGRIERPFAPLNALAIAERRIALRHWSASSPAAILPPAAMRVRAAA